MSNNAEIIINGESYTFPIMEGTEGEKAIDISDLRKKTGYITLDPGFVNTGACKSEITFIDGERGILRYRGNSYRGPYRGMQFCRNSIFTLTRKSSGSGRV